MKCDVIQDLIPLYVDGCCSEESARLVEAHLETCEGCRNCVKNAEKPLVQMEKTPAKPFHNSRISVWKASILQSVLFLLYFGVITVGVALEAAMPSGLLNGFWAFNVVVPATGFLLSLVNWYFVRLYKSKKAFVIGSFICTVLTTVCCCVWSAYHYDALFFVPLFFTTGIDGILFSAVNLLLSAVLSNLYAKMMGKE